MITLDAIRLPDGLRWSDEFDWSPVAQETAFSLTGALLVQEAAKQAGRPMTLLGGSSGTHFYAWMPRSDVLALRTLLDQPSTTRTLTLHDGRRFTVIPRRDQGSPLSVAPLAIIDEVGPADPTTVWRYTLNELRLTILAEL